VLEAGAGGNWRVFNEILDPNVVKQSTTLACGAACGEMLLASKLLDIEQDVIEVMIGIGQAIDAQNLASVLQQLDPDDSRTWLGGHLRILGRSDEYLINVLNSTGSWAAMMWEQHAPIGHFVVIDGLDYYGRIKVRDPWDGTSYKMEMKDFLAHWSGNGVYSLYRK
jgi:filamentous hemagglutinin